MQNAVTVLYRDRVERGLEFEAVLDILPPPEIFGCSEQTKEIGEELLD